MSTKEETAELLESARGRFLSGSEIAKKLGVSRTAVWKAIGSLERDGYSIEAVSGKGYRLAPDHDRISPGGVRAYLRDPDKTPLQVFEQTGSTNDVIREAAAAGAREGTLAVAAAQTKGRGRKGRAFYSPEGSGVYFSFLLRPDPALETASRITIIAAVAVAQALQKCGVEDVAIKWVNDVFVRGKKVCGILTEATSGMETGTIDYAVVGIGINVYTPPGGFPAEIADVAGSAFGEDPIPDARNKLAAYTYDTFFELYRSKDPKAVTDAYRSLCFVPGRRVTVIKPGGSREALALSLDENCRLRVRYEDGTEESLSSGEISLQVHEE